MKNKRLWISIIAGVLAAVMVLSLIVAILPRGASAASSSELKEQLDELQAQKDAISEKLEALEKEQFDNLDEIGKIIAQKDVIDQQVALLYAEVTNVNSQIAAYNLLISDKQKELDAAEERLADLNERNKDRIRAMEEEGELSYWSVLFLANDFADLLDRVNMIQEIAAADQRRLDEMAKVAQQIADAKQVLADEKAELEEAKADLEASQKELDEKDLEADALLAELVEISEGLDSLHEQFEREEQEFLDQLFDKEQEYKDQLETEEASRQESIRESIEASIQESIRESIEASKATKPTKPSGSDGSYGSNIDPDGIVWITPVAYSRVSSPFGYRWHPVTGQWAMHNGVDLPAPKGTPIYATRSGYVTKATYHNTAGNYVTIDHGDGYSSVYMHMTHYIVEKGEYVKAGQLIGYVGTTGRSKGYHLHFGIAYKGTYVDPMDYIG